MSRKGLNYNKHVVDVISLPLRDGGLTVHVNLERHAPSHSDVTHFETGQRFATGDEALTTGIELGKRKVNEGCEGGTPVVNN
jgi:hypothetical protein